MQQCSAKKDLESPTYTTVFSKQRPRIPNLHNSVQQTKT